MQKDLDGIKLWDHSQFIVQPGPFVLNTVEQSIHMLIHVGGRVFGCAVLYMSVWATQIQSAWHAIQFWKYVLVMTDKNVC